MGKIRRFGKRVLGLLYPEQARCMGCGDLSGTESGWLCPECAEKAEQLDLLRLPRCPRCGALLPDAGKCYACRDWPEDAVSSASYRYGYASPISDAIRQMKYSGVYRMTEWMGGDVVELMRHDGLEDCDMLVPVPMHPSRLRERGRNQARAIAEIVSVKTGIPLKDALVRVVNTKQQARQSAAVRRKALHNAIAAAPGTDLAGKRLLLIDDVITTGATINACAAVLRAAGAADVRAAAFAGHISAKLRENGKGQQL